MDDVENGEHPREARGLAVPERRRDDTIEQETLESLLDVELCVENNESERNGESVVACMRLEKVADGDDGGIVSVLRMGHRLAARRGPSAGAGRGVHDDR